MTQPPILRLAEFVLTPGFAARRYYRKAHADIINRNIKVTLNDNIQAFISEVLSRIICIAKEIRLTKKDGEYCVVIAHNQGGVTSLDNIDSAAAAWNALNYCNEGTAMPEYSWTQSRTNGMSCVPGLM